MIKKITKINGKIKDKIINNHTNNIDILSKKARKSALKFEKEAKKTTATAIAAAFSFVIALFWRDAVQDLITYFLEKAGLTGSTYIAKILAALFVTLIGVIAIMRISKWGEIEKTDKIN